jgi:hypothetical protein
MPLRKFLVWGVMAAALAISASTAFWHFYLRRPVGEGPVVIDITRHAFDQPWIQQPVFLVGMGDSITAGFGASPGFGYFDRLVVSPPEDFPDMRDIHLSRVLPQLRTTNLAISGSTSLQLERVQLPRLPRQDEAVLGLVVLTIGWTSINPSWAMAFSAPSSGDRITTAAIPITGIWRTWKIPMIEDTTPCDAFS